MSPSEQAETWSNGYVARTRLSVAGTFGHEPTSDPELTRWHFTRNAALARAVVSAGDVCLSETGEELTGNAWAAIRAALSADMREPFCPENVIQRMGRLMLEPTS